MAKSSIGNAYLNVIPKMEGDAKGLGNQFGTEMSGGLKGAVTVGAVAVGNILANMVTSIASGLGETVSKAFWNYADYEQLVGGVDTLFKDASSTVQQNAQMAFQTAGMSANEYMENVTSFSASLISSLDGDTQKAAAVADKAMVDMSDNANKMGTDMESITMAYQGFAKQNYTMLDNLKLGYGGTKSEMERLLADAGKIAGVEFNIDSYSDVIEAIHVMQEEMGITGTTMEEGSTTISGSLNQLNGAWENFLTAIGDGGATMDMSVVTENLINSLIAVGENVIPAVGRIAVSIATALPGALAEAIANVMPDIQASITEAFGEDAGAMFGEFLTSADGIGQKISEVFTAIQGIIEQAMPIIQELIVPVLTVVSEAVTTAVDTVMSVLSGVLDFVNENVMPVVQAIADTIMPIVEQVAEDVSGGIDVVKGAFDEAMPAIQELIDEVWPPISDTISTVMDVIVNVVGPAWERVKGIITTVMGVIRGIIQTVWPVITGIIRTAVNTIKTVIGTISNIVSGVSETFNNIKNAITEPIETAKNAIKTAMDTISSIIGGLKLELPKFKLPHFNISGGEVPWGIGGAGTPPKISVDWYAKGGLVNGATLIGAGERGTELIWPAYDPYMSKYADAIASRMDINGGTYNTYLQYDAGADANQMARDLARMTKRYQLAKGA